MQSFGTLFQAVQGVDAGNRNAVSCLQLPRRHNMGGRTVDAGFICTNSECYLL